MESGGVSACCACSMSLPGGTMIVLAPETWEEGQGVLRACPRGRSGLASVGAVLKQEKAVAAPGGDTSQLGTGVADIK